MPNNKECSYQTEEKSFVSTLSLDKLLKTFLFIVQILLIKSRDTHGQDYFSRFPSSIIHLSPKHQKKKKFTVLSPHPHSQLPLGYLHDILDVVQKNGESHRLTKFATTKGDTDVIFVMPIAFQNHRSVGTSKCSWDNELIILV